MLHVAMCMAENTYSIPASGNGNKRCAIAIERCVRREFSAVNHSNVHSESGCTAVVKSLLTVTTLLQQILDCGCCAQCKWR